MLYQASAWMSSQRLLSRPRCCSVSLIRLCSYIMRASWVLLSKSMAFTYLVSFSIKPSYCLFYLYNSMRVLLYSLRTAFFSLRIFICNTAPIVSFSAEQIPSCYLWYFNSLTISFTTFSKSSRWPLMVSYSLLRSPPSRVFSRLSNICMARCDASICSWLMREATISYFSFVASASGFLLKILFEPGATGTMCDLFETISAVSSRRCCLLKCSIEFIWCIGPYPIDIKIQHGYRFHFFNLKLTKRMVSLILPCIAMKVSIWSVWLLGEDARTFLLCYYEWRCIGFFGTNIRVTVTTNGWHLSDRINLFHHLIN